MNMENTPSPSTNDLAKISEQYAQMMQQTMAAALANMEAVQAEAQKAHVAALDELADARDEKRRIEASAQQVAEAHIEQHRQKLRQKSARKPCFPSPKACWKRAAKRLKFRTGSVFRFQ